jgi:hypothetical protein
MTFCDLRETCFLFNYGLSGMPKTTEFLKYRYCMGNFNECPWYVNCKGLWQQEEENNRE